MALSDRWMREVYWDEKNDDKRISNLTFCGALEKCYFDIAYFWKSKDTKKKNESSYENVILPALTNHNDKRIADYTREDYEEAMETIRRRGYNDNGVMRFYADASLKNFERLIYYVVFQASVRGYCENVLWGTHFQIDDIKVEDRIHEKVQLKKSLTPRQEKMLANELLGDVARVGEGVAVLLMFGLGTRNAEACGLNYGDIKRLQEFPQDIVAWIYKSTIPDSSILQSSGKTWNAGRIVPVPQKIAEYLEQRKQMLMEHLEELGVLNEVDIEELPIACKGDMFEGKNYEKRASAKCVTDAAKTFFEKIKLEGKQLAFIEAELLDNECGEIINEKDPTAYLLRRNYATHLQILGFSVPEIQYLIGHNVEDIYESRNEFVDEKRLHEMARKLSGRPLLNEIVNNDESIEIMLQRGEETRVTVEAQEPLDTLEITVLGDKINETYSGRYYVESYDRKYERCIDITKTYQKTYC